MTPDPAVRAAAIAAASQTMRDTLDLRGIELPWTDIDPAAKAVVDVVLSAVTGPLMRAGEVQGLREAAEDSYAGRIDGNPNDPCMVSGWLRARADWKEGQP